MLKKKSKKSYGAYDDYFLEGCEVVVKPFDITHVHILELNTFVPGIYGYEPKTGILTQDGDHMGMLTFDKAQRASLKPGKIVFLKHKETWKEMVANGRIKEEPSAGPGIMQQMQGLGNLNGLGGSRRSAQLPPQATPSAPAKKTSGFLKSLFSKK